MRILFTAFLAIVITSSMVSSSWADLKEAIEAYYENRYGVALREFQPLAEEGVVEAKFYLGVMHKDGKGVPRDLVKAYMWFNLSAAQGYEDAYRARVLVARMMTREEIAQGQRLAREGKDKKEDCSPAKSPCP